MLLLNLKFKINSMVALLLAAILVGLLAGMDLLKLLKTVKSGFGDTLGELAISSDRQKTGAWKETCGGSQMPFVI
jgi:predicted histidine transporter YuiF (NhaC family)